MGQVDKIRDLQSSDLTESLNLQHKLEGEIKKYREVEIPNLKQEIELQKERFEISNSKNEEKIRRNCEVLHQDAVKKLKDEFDAEKDRNIFELNLQFEDQNSRQVE